MPHPCLRAFCGDRVGGHCEPQQPRRQRNCAISIGIRCAADRSNVRRTGGGAIFSNGRRERRAASRRMSVSSEGDKIPRCQRSRQSTLPQTTREGWGNQLKILSAKNGPAPPGPDEAFEYCLVILRPASSAGRRIYEFIPAANIKRFWNDLPPQVIQRVRFPESWSSTLSGKTNGDKTPAGYVCA